MNDKQVGSAFNLVETLDSKRETYRLCGDNFGKHLCRYILFGTQTQLYHAGSASNMLRTCLFV